MDKHPTTSPDIALPLQVSLLEFSEFVYNYIRPGVL